jgi:CelD/BcsL family acetyltransferase involved in cellulose biosynthesis
MSSGPLRAELEPLASLDAARDGWDDLAAAVGNPFATWAWADAWWRVYGGGRRLALWRVRDRDGRAAAILPLYATGRGPLTVLRFLGHGAADELGPLCAPADRPLAAAALRRVTRDSGAGTLLLAERLPGDAGFADLLRGRVLQREPSPLLATGGLGWDDWLATKSSNFRGQARRMERKLARDHDLRFRLAEDPDRLGADLQTLFTLHDARWEEEGGSAAFDEDRRAFHRAFAERALADGRLRLWLAEVDGAPAAAWYGLRFAGQEWYYQLGRDPGWDRYKVGFVLLVHTIRSAFEDGMTHYRFGLGGEEYKERFATGDPGVETVVAGPGAPAATAAAGLAPRLPPAARRLLRGRG